MDVYYTWLISAICDKWFHNFNKLVGFSTQFQIHFPSAKPKKSWAELYNSVWKNYLRH